MSAYTRDLVIRIVATALAAVAGLAVTELGDQSVWWAVPVAAAVTVLRSWFASTASGAALTADVLEHTGWTAAQAALTVLPIAGFGLPVELLPVGMAVLAAVKGWIARRVADPDTAGTVHIPRHAAR